MKKLTCLFTFILFAFNLLAQNFKTDTVDYTNFLKRQYYDFVKITESTSNRQLALTSPHKQLLSMYVSAVSSNSPIPISANDTVMFAEWDIEKGDNFINLHAAGKIRLNKKSNVITLQKRKWTGNNISDIILRQFKIIKLTNHEVILLDLTYTKKNRIYYFK